MFIARRGSSLWQAGSAATAPAATGAAAGMTSMAGGGSPLANMQPYLAITCIIALEDVFPPRQ